MAELIHRLTHLNLSVIFDSYPEPPGWVLCTFKDDTACYSMECGPSVSYAFMKTLEKCRHPEIGKLLKEYRVSQMGDQI